MSDTTYSEQEIWNFLYGSNKNIWTRQNIANLYKTNISTTYESLQAIMNEYIGNPNSTYWSVQQCLFNNLQSLLGLTGTSPTYLSEQVLLNRAYNAGATLQQVLTGTGGTGGGSNVGLNAVLTLIGP
jgi:hypothetical protein